MKFYNEELLSKYQKSQKKFIILTIIGTILLVGVLLAGLLILNRKNQEYVLVPLIIVSTLLLLVDIFFLTYGIIDQGRSIKHINAALNSTPNELSGKIKSVKDNHLYLPFGFRAIEVEFDDGIINKSYYLLDIFDPKDLPINETVKMKIYASSILEVNKDE